ncbi:hypothetical protein J6590_038105 [Homalodisca vitripennis]|nr:hypothetical protein J6590_038105 [Homalodisca vitripennis]
MPQPLKRIWGSERKPWGESQPGPSTSGQTAEHKSPAERKRDKDDPDGRKKRVSIVSTDSKDKSSEDEKTEDESLMTKIMTFLKFLYAFINSVMVTMTRYLNKLSRDYRYVMRTLAIEKKLLKEKQGFGQGLRTGSSMIWQPLPYSVTSKPKSSSDSSDDQVQSPDTDGTFETRERLKAAAVPIIRILAPSLERGLDSDCR